MIKNIGNFEDKIDGTIKCVYEMENKKIVEMSVLYNKEDKDVVCVPTHHFCNLGCKMCHLTNKGLNKKMIRIEIDDFMKCLIETLKNYYLHSTSYGLSEYNKELILLKIKHYKMNLLSSKITVDQSYKNSPYMEGYDFSDENIISRIEKL